jgi:hypothetical protein
VKRQIHAGVGFGEYVYWPISCTLAITVTHNFSITITASATVEAKLKTDYSSEVNYKLQLISATSRTQLPLVPSKLDFYNLISDGI